MLFFCRRRALSDPGRYLTVGKGQSKTKVNTDSAVKQDTMSPLSSPSILPRIQSHIFSSKVDTSNNRDEINIPKIKEDSPFVPDTYAMVIDQDEIQPEKLVQASKFFGGLDSLPHNFLEPSPRKTRRKTELEQTVRHQSQFVHLYDKNRVPKDAIYTTQDECAGIHYLEERSDQVLGRLTALKLSLETNRPGFSRGCDFQEPSVLNPNIDVKKMASLYTKTESGYDDDDDDDDIVPAGDKFSSDEDSDSCRGSRKISNTSIDSDSGRDSRISYNSIDFF